MNDQKINFALIEAETRLYMAMDIDNLPAIEKYESIVGALRRELASARKCA